MTRPRRSTAIGNQPVLAAPVRRLTRSPTSASKLATSPTRPPRLEREHTSATPITITPDHRQVAAHSLLAQLARHARRRVARRRPRGGSACAPPANRGRRIISIASHDSEVIGIAERPRQPARERVVAPTPAAIVLGFGQIVEQPEKRHDAADRQQQAHEESQPGRRVRTALHDEEVAPPRSRRRRAPRSASDGGVTLPT
mgnify:CR=1 FL=1